MSLNFCRKLFQRILYSVFAHDICWWNILQIPLMLASGLVDLCNVFCCGNHAAIGRFDFSNGIYHSNFSRNGNFHRIYQLDGQVFKMKIYYIFVCAGFFFWKKRRDPMLHKIFRYHVDEFKLMNREVECVLESFNDSSNLNKMSFIWGLMGISTRFSFVSYIQQRN